MPHKIFALHKEYPGLLFYFFPVNFAITLRTLFWAVKPYHTLVIKLHKLFSINFSSLNLFILSSPLNT